MASRACCDVPPKGEPAVVSEDQLDQAAGVTLCVYINNICLDIS
jgi:hypothetical protein